MGKLIRENRKAWKNLLSDRLIEYLSEYGSCLIIGVDNISSHQIQLIRIALRGRAVMLMGKNTRIRRGIEMHAEGKDPLVAKLLPHIKENVGFIFTNDDLGEIKKIVEDHKFKAPAKVGAIAPVDVVIPAQQTSLGPEKTSFFQALQISTKISKGKVEIMNDVNLIKKGDKVSPSEATLLKTLNITPFHYMLQIKQVYQKGSCFDPMVLDITDDDIMSRFKTSFSDLVAASVAIGVPNPYSAGLFAQTAFKSLLAITLAACEDVDSCWLEQAKSYKEILADPEKMKAAAAVATSAPAATSTSAAPAAATEAAPAESEESDEEEGMFDLFG